ncbi:cupin domain-containing protein [Robertkochia aurantiaca]|uniref:cupin domain-containing protein n=1 Tax=Robertkochia aurantiaca TaxID=2873700 RepID=UPI001CCE7453|nr:cupin domain-containing protein [Robertkochia sp. 3YJGBD-33]
MAIVDKFNYVPLSELEDPDDFRPKSKLALITDPGDAENGHVADMVVFQEQIAPGDSIPLHKHTIEEVMVVVQGQLEVRLGSIKKTAEKGAVIFIPAKTAHGFKNTGSDPAQITAVFPSHNVDIRYLERNPAPGTEKNFPGAPVSIDVREFVHGNMAEAVKPLSPEAFD